MSQADTFICPHCDRQYRFKPELEGKRIRCKCGEKFTVEAPVFEEPDDEFDSYDLHEESVENEGDGDGPDWSALLGNEGQAPAPVAASSSSKCPSCGAAVKQAAAICVQCGTDLKSGKKRGQTKISQQFSETHDTPASAIRTKVTGVGLLIHGLGFLLIVLGTGLATGGGILIARGNSAGEVIVMIGGFAVLGGMPMIVIGPFLGLAAPADAGRALLIASIACLIGGIVFSVMIAMEQIPQWLSIAENIPFLIGAGCFLGFLQKLSVYLDDDSLYQRTEFLLKLFFGIMILSVAVFVPILGCFAALAAVVANIIFAFAYTGTVCQAGMSAIKS